jgi:hypothetical protein
VNGATTTVTTPTRLSPDGSLYMGANGRGDAPGRS